MNRLILELRKCQKNPQVLHPCMMSTSVNVAYLFEMDRVNWTTRNSFLCSWNVLMLASPYGHKVKISSNKRFIVFELKNEFVGIPCSSLSMNRLP